MARVNLNEWSDKQLTNGIQCLRMPEAEPEMRLQGDEQLRISKISKQNWNRGEFPSRSQNPSLIK